MKEHFKAPEKIQLSDKEIANLPDAQFKTLVISMPELKYGKNNNNNNKGGNAGYTK